MEMLDPTSVNSGLFLVVLASAIATILAAFLVLAFIARVGFKIKISISSFITSVVTALLSFVVIGVFGPTEANNGIAHVQLYSLGMFIATIIVFFLMLKLLRPKTLEEQILKKYNSSPDELKSHFKNILNELNDIEKKENILNVNHGLMNKIFNKFSKKGSSNVGK